MSEEFEAFEPSGTRTISSHSLVSSDSTAPLSPDHPLTHALPTLTPTRVSFHHRTARTQPTLSPGMSARIAKVAALYPSSFSKRYKSSYETPSPSSSLTLLVRKRYQVTSELIEDTEGESLEPDSEREGSEDENDEGQGLDDKGQGLEDEGPGQSFRFVPEQEGAESISAFRQPTLFTWVDPKDGRVYTDILTYAPPAALVQTPPSLEWSFGFLPVLPSSLVVPSPIASPVATPAATISVNKDQFLELGEQLELYRSILHDHMSGAVRDEIFLQRYRFRSLEREHKRATVTFSAMWRPVLDLEAWADFKERRKRLELTDRVPRMERSHESGGE
nr:hypothetical protein [Tanacetum cinerariifolium]